jgi:hypothetical protein
MEDLAARGSALEYWFFRTGTQDMSILVDLIVRRAERRAETRVVIRVGERTEVVRSHSDTWTADSTGIRAGDDVIAPGAATGEVGEIRWVLDIDPGPDRIRPLPPALAWLRPFDMQLLSRPTASFTGSVTIGDRTWSLLASPGMVSHYWGRALPPRWTWVSVVGTTAEPRIEATVLATRLWGSPFTIRAGYYWRSSDHPGGRATLAVMPLNAWLRAVRGDADVRLRARRPLGLDVEVRCSAPGATFVELGDGIRQSLTATMVVGDQRVPAALELREHDGR